MEIIELTVQLMCSISKLSELSEVAFFFWLEDSKIVMFWSNTFSEVVCTFLSVF